MTLHRFLPLAAALVFGAATTGSALAQSGTDGQADTTYVDYSIQDLCNRIGSKLGSVSVDECLSINMQPTGHYSVQSVAIGVSEFPALDYHRPAARVLLLGGIHGDEYSSVSIVFKWIRMLTESNDRRFHWRIAPIANPDGMLRRRAQRMNHNGVDLNRNFPTPEWDELSQKYWIKRTRRNPRAAVCSSTVAPMATAVNWSAGILASASACCSRCGGSCTGSEVSWKVPQWIASAASVCRS